MPVTQIADVIVPAEFTAYQVENSLVSTALFQSGVAVRNGEMASQLQAGAEQFTVPFWGDAGENDPDVLRNWKGVFIRPFPPLAPRPEPRGICRLGKSKIRGRIAS